MKKYGLLTFVIALIIGFITVSFYVRPTVSDKNAVSSDTYKTEIRDLSGFTKIDASGALNIVIIVGKDFKVELESEQKDLDTIETEFDGDILKIHSKKSWSMPKNDVAVRISMPTLEGVEISGSSKGIISNVKSDDFSLTLNGSSTVKISGEAKNVEMTANGSSNIEAESLKTENATVEMNGSSNATINVSNSLDASAYGASRIKYTGNPKDVKQNTSGASSVSQK
jgi:Putative auto-transporter adhesin, head GIN domain